MIAVDTNVLVYAHRLETEHHGVAARVLAELAEGQTHWAIAWPCLYEFLRIITHPRVFDPPLSARDAVESVESILDSPSLVMLGEGPTHRSQLRRAVIDGGASGNLMHDAHIAALLSEHGVREILSFDRDFSRFPGLRLKTPGQR